MAEVFIALAIGGAFLATVLGAWFFSSKTWQEEKMRSTLRLYTEKAMEKIKEDIRLSDSNNLLYNPSSAASYTAISIPRTTLSNGLMTFSGGGTSGTIVWNRTVIYHVYTNSGRQELRRTVFPTYNSSASARQTELDNVVTAGDGNSTGGTTAVLFSAGTVTLDIVPRLPTFDGYSSSTARSSDTTFGSIKLAAGNHTIRFEVTGKNASSSGYRMGIDSITLAPSGGRQEAEELSVYANSGGSASTELMTVYSGATWGGNQQVEYSSTAAGNYITFQTYYDQWLESNFSNVTHSNTEVIGTGNPYVTVLSRESQSLTPAWNATTQTGAGSSSTNDATAGGTSVRSIISASAISRSGDMMRFKFVAASDVALVINSAYFGVRSAGSANFSSFPQQLYFSNPTVVEGGTDGIGSIATSGPAAVTIPNGYHIWSNWVVYSMSSANDFLVSMNVDSGSSASVWTPSPPGALESYRVTDAGNLYAGSMTDWTPLPGYDATSSATYSVYGVSQMATWIKTGAVTSQIYDSKITSPAYAQLSWASVLPSSSSISMKARSSSSSSMTGATDWSLIAGFSASPVTLALSNQQYVQFQATLTAANPYATFPQLDNVLITWPGQTSYVDISGYYTKKSNYGIFKVLVDGVQPSKGLEIKLTTSDTFRGKTYSSYLNSEAKPMNTGK